MVDRSTDMRFETDDLNPADDLLVGIWLAGIAFLKAPVWKPDWEEFLNWCFELALWLARFPYAPLWLTESALLQHQFKNLAVNHTIRFICYDAIWLTTSRLLVVAII